MSCLADVKASIDDKTEIKPGPDAQQPFKWMTFFYSTVQRK